MAQSEKLENKLAQLKKAISSFESTIVKVLFTIVFIFGFCLTTLAQIDFKSPPWETGCDSLTSQMEMNICSGQKFLIADSILNSYYDKLIKYVDSQYMQEQKEFNDTSDSYQREYLYQLKAQKETIIKSKSDFKIFLNSTTDIIDYQYNRGSMRPMAVNIYALDITVNQIKVLIDLMDEIIDK